MLAFGIGFDNYEKLLKGAHDMDVVCMPPPPSPSLPIPHLLYPTVYGPYDGSSSAFSPPSNPHKEYLDKNGGG